MVTDPRERAAIVDHFVAEWGFDPAYVDRALTLIALDIDDMRVFDLARSIAGFARDNPDCNAAAMQDELMLFLRDVSAADGVIDEREELAIAAIAQVFADQRRITLSGVAGHLKGLLRRPALPPATRWAQQQAPCNLPRANWPPVGPEQEPSNVKNEINSADLGNACAGFGHDEIGELNAIARRYIEAGGLVMKLAEWARKAGSTALSWAMPAHFQEIWMRPSAWLYDTPTTSPLAARPRLGRTPRPEPWPTARGLGRKASAGIRCQRCFWCSWRARWNCHDLGRSARDDDAHLALDPAGCCRARRRPHRPGRARAMYRGVRTRWSVARRP